ncbi:MAG: class I SAM-dependent methyltransferase [Acidimicrobiales bacterium]|nr:class I SAM-dependent methyltransferase [Acidimicrobiales bacterium]
MTQKTWNEFWGEFLLVEMHRDNPIRWSSREERAAWIVDRLGLSSGAAVLGLGCGDGFLEICLGRLGMRVTGVDRLEEVLALARKEVQGEEVEFLAADLRELECRPNSYDAVLIIETLGLMSKEDDADLISRVATWLKPGGGLLADCPKGSEGPDSKGTRASPVPGGRLTMTWNYDPRFRIQSITPRFERDDGTTIELMDPYDPSRGSVEGILRYIYPISELRSMLNEHGLVPEEVEHFSSPNYHCVIVRKREDA